MNRLWLTFTLLFVLMSVSSLTADAQEDEQPNFFLPAIHGYVQPTPSPTPVPTPFTRPIRGRQPIDVDPRYIVFYPFDFLEDDYDYDYRNEFEYELTQIGYIQVTDELQNAGVTKGFLTYMVRDEDFIPAGPQELGTAALVFASEDQARAYYHNTIQGFVDAGLERYLGGSFRESATVYVRRETINGVQAVYGNGISIRFNVVFNSYSIDTDGTDLTDYLHRMDRRFLPLINGDP